MKPEFRELPIGQIIPNPEQPRQVFDAEKLRSLAASIEQTGLINPVTVEATEDPETFLLEDGERRWRAMKLAGFDLIPAIVKPARNNGTAAQDRLVAAMAANLQREDMNPVEEARALDKLYQKFGTYRAVAERIGLTDVYVRSRILLLQLEDEILDLIADGSLQRNQRVVDALLTLPSEVRIKAARRFAVPGMTIEMVEKAVRKLRAQLEAAQPGEEDKEPAVRYAARQVGRPNRMIFDQLHKQGKLPSWMAVKKAAGEACAQCAFGDNPSEEICSECPAVFFVAQLVLIGSKE